MNLNNVLFWNAIDSFERRYKQLPEFIELYDQAMKLHDAGKTRVAIQFLNKLIDRHDMDEV
jgi:hypothetical protein